MFGLSFGLSLSGITGGGGTAAFTQFGVRPYFVMDTPKNKYLTSGPERSYNLSELMTSVALGNATVIDKDGVLKWRLHNLFLNSETGATQSITVVSGVAHSIRFKGTGSIVYSGAAAGTLTGTGANDIVRVEVTAGSATLTCTVSGSITVVGVYRSDLGGMQLNSKDGTDYLPTSGAAGYALRRDYSRDTVNGEILGEPAGVNLLLNSATLSTQNIATSAQKYTVSFWGTGTITFSGTHTGTLAGTGAGDRVKVTFTPSAGTLTCTVSGAVTYANAEAYYTDTSYIFTGSSSEARAKDEASTVIAGGIPGFIQGSGSLVFEGSCDYETGGSGFPVLAAIDDGTTGNRLIVLGLESSGSYRFFVTTAGSTTASIGIGSSVASGEALKMAARWDTGDFGAAIDGTAFTAIATGTPPSGLTTVRIGAPGGVTVPTRISRFSIGPYASPVASPGWSDAQLAVISGS
jgi:hypothetical protein